MKFITVTPNQDSNEWHLHVNLLSEYLQRPVSFLPSRKVKSPLQTSPQTAIRLHQQRYPRPTAAASPTLLLQLGPFRRMLPLHRSKFCPNSSFRGPPALLVLPMLPTAPIVDTIRLLRTFAAGGPNRLLDAVGEQFDLTMMTQFRVPRRYQAGRACIVAA